MTIVIGQRYVHLREFNPKTKKPGKQWRRHENCKPLPMEHTRLSDKPKP
jgi:hypothetical protein